MNIKLPTFEECNAIEREDRTPLEAFVWQHEPSNQVSLDEFRKLLGAVIEAERAQVETLREALTNVTRIGPLGVDTYRECYRLIQKCAEDALTKVPR